VGNLLVGRLRVAAKEMLSANADKRSPHASVSDSIVENLRAAHVRVQFLQRAITR
jgi:hypothetical protein